MKLFFIRHGETTANVNKLYAGQTNVPLTDLGKEQAKAIQPILAPFQFDKVYSSDLSRAIDTQRLALPGIIGEPTPLLREYDVGSLVGQPFTCGVKAISVLPGRSKDYTPFGGENGEMVCSRVRQFLSMLEENPCDYVAAFAHNGVLQSMMQVLLREDYYRPSFPNPNCVVHVFEYDGNIWRLLAFNYGGKI